MSSTQLPLEYLVTSSENCLEGFELARLNQISNLRKEFSQVLDDLIEAETAARLARWMLEGRRTQGQCAPLAQTALGRTSAHEAPATAAPPQQAPLLRGNSKSVCCGRYQNFSSCKQARRRPRLTAGRRRSVRPSMKRRSGFGDARPPIAAVCSAALELLERAAACDAHAICCSAHRAEGNAQHGFFDGARMVPFPGAHAFENTESVAFPTSRPTTLARVLRQTTVVAPLPCKILSLPRSQSCNGQGGRKLPEDPAEAGRREVSSDGKARNVVRPFPPVRAPLRKPLVYGNVALSRF